MADGLLLICNLVNLSSTVLVLVDGGGGGHRDGVLSRHVMGGVARVGGVLGQYRGRDHGGGVLYWHGAGGVETVHIEHTVRHTVVQGGGGGSDGVDGCGGGQEAGGGHVDGGQGYGLLQPHQVPVLQPHVLKMTTINDPPTTPPSLPDVS